MSQEQPKRNIVEKKIEKKEEEEPKPKPTTKKEEVIDEEKLAPMTSTTSSTLTTSTKTTTTTTDKVVKVVDKPKITNEKLAVNNNSETNDEKPYQDDKDHAIWMPPKSNILRHEIIF